MLIITVVLTLICHGSFNSLYDYLEARICRGDILHNYYTQEDTLVESIELYDMEKD